MQQYITVETTDLKLDSIGLTLVPHVLSKALSPIPFYKLLIEEVYIGLTRDRNVKI